MGTKSEDSDPWESTDPALALALKELDWYRQNRDWARNADKASEVLLIVVSAATTVAAALSVTAWVTAVLAAGVLIIAGLRKSFDWHETWLTSATRWSELRAVVHQYRLLSDNCRDDEARRSLVSSVDQIVSTETVEWASRRRNLHERT